MKNRIRIAVMTLIFTVPFISQSHSSTIRSEDAILIANFDSIQVGMKSIRSRMLNNYKPKLTYNVKHSYSRIVDLGDYIFANVHYKDRTTIPKNGELTEVSDPLFFRTDAMKNKTGNSVIH